MAYSNLYGHLNYFDLTIMIHCQNSTNCCYQTNHCNHLFLYYSFKTNLYSRYQQCSSMLYRLFVQLAHYILLILLKYNSQETSCLALLLRYLLSLLKLLKNKFYQPCIHTKVWKDLRLDQWYYPRP